MICQGGYLSELTVARATGTVMTNKEAYPHLSCCAFKLAVLSPSLVCTFVGTFPTQPFQNNALKNIQDRSVWLRVGKRFTRTAYTVAANNITAAPIRRSLRGTP
jgi:hypothetical protein